MIHLPRYSHEGSLRSPPLASSPSTPSLGRTLFLYRRPLLALGALLSVFLLLSSSPEVANDRLHAAGEHLGFSRLKDVFVPPRLRVSGDKESSITAKEKPERKRRWLSPTPSLPPTASLHDRLQDLWDAPSSEPANWVQWSQRTCPKERMSRAQNDWLVQDSSHLWHSLNSSQIRGFRKGMVDYLVECEARGLLNPKNAGEGRGLVFTAGNSDTFERVLLSLRLLKKFYGTSLPSEIFSFPGEVPPPELLPEFEAHNVTLRYIEDASRDSSRTKNYQIKSDAIVASRFAEVLYLDSDNMPCGYLGEADGRVNTTHMPDESYLLWNAPAYKRLGAMFWPDYWKTSPVNPIWAIIGTQCRDEWEQEAGQILIDKRRHMDALLLTNWFLDNWQFWFKISDGDKDLFRFAFLALRKRWAAPGRYVGAGALPLNTMTGFCGHTMMQYDHLGYPMFVHANLLKQIVSGIRRGFTWGRTRQTGLFNGGDPLVEGGEGGGDVEADMLANAASDGTAIVPAPPGVRYRAALERGLWTRFHGGERSALCVDMHWDDPRTRAELLADEAYEAAHPRPLPPLAPEGATEEEKKKAEEERKKAEEDAGKGRYTVGKDKKTGETIEIDWKANPLLVDSWGNEPRLKDFETHFYDEGGKPTGKGF